MEYAFHLQRGAAVSTAFVSLVFLVRLWWKGELFGAQRFFCVWFVGAGALQLVAQGNGVWMVGLLVQCILAIVLILKDQMDSIY